MALPPTRRRNSKHISQLLFVTGTFCLSTSFTASAFYLLRRQRPSRSLTFKGRGGTGGKPSETVSFRVRSNIIASKHHKSKSLYGAQSDDSIVSSTIDNTSPSSSSSTQGRWILCIVALLYGTLNVSLRSVYGGVPQPPSAAALSVTRGWLATLAFFIVAGTTNRSMSANQSHHEQKSMEVSNKKERVMTDSSSNKTYSVSLVLGGLELAIWNGLAQGLLNVGLLSTGSARASFLTQSSVVWTPLLVTLFMGRQKSVPVTTWIGCAIALCGISLLSFGSVGSDSSSSGGMMTAAVFSVGDVFVMGGALAWSTYLIRLGTIGDRYPEIPLQFIKTFLLGILYTVWFIFSLVNNSTGSILSNFSTSMAWAVGPGSLAAWGALIYSAIGPGALADVLQQQGQRTVPPSQANVLLSLEPVFAAVCAWVLLGESITVTETIGGSLIVLAALVTTMTGSKSEHPRNETDDTNGTI